MLGSEGARVGRFVPARRAAGPQHLHHRALDLDPKTIRRRPRPALAVETLAWLTVRRERIEARPGVLAAKLARSLGRPRDELKRDVRKLKALGLTFSLEIGYRLTPKGAALLKHCA